MTGAEIPVAMAVAPELLAGTAAVAAPAVAAPLAGTAATSAIAPILGAAPEVASATALPGLLEPMMLAQGAAPTFSTSASMAPTMGDMLASTGGIDPRAMDMGHANFNNPMEQARLKMAQMGGPKTAMQGAKGLLNSGIGGGQPQAAPAQRPPSQQSAPQSQAEIMERLKRQQGNRSNFAGLLGQAIGGY